MYGVPKMIGIVTNFKFW